jgi:hypothetical protein
MAKLQKLALYVTFFLVTSLMVSSCSKDPSQGEVTPSSDLNPISYREGILQGERVLIPSNVPMSAFDYTTVYGSNSNARVATPKKISLEELANIVKPYVDKHPDLSYNPIRKNDLEKIFHDFPDIKSEQEVREKSDIVILYYNGLMKVEIKPAVEKAEKAKSGGRVGASSFGSINSFEWNHLYNNASMISRYYYASTRAQEETVYRFPNPDRLDGFIGNSFQHAIWNCLIIREAMLVGYTKNNAILFTRNITSDHEYGDTGQRVLEELEAMDLHNNLSARSWFNNNSSGSVWPFVMNVPSESNIYDAWYHASTNRNFVICNAAVSIPNLFSGGWDFLYGTATANMGDRLYHIYPVPPGC